MEQKSSEQPTEFPLFPGQPVCTERTVSHAAPPHVLKRYTPLHDGVNVYHTSLKLPPAHAAPSEVAAVVSPDTLPIPIAIALPQLSFAGGVGPPAEQFGFTAFRAATNAGSSIRWATFGQPTRQCVMMPMI